MSDDAPGDQETEARLAAFRALRKDFSGIDPVDALEDPAAKEMLDWLMSPRPDCDGH